MLLSKYWTWCKLWQQNHDKMSHIPIIWVLRPRAKRSQNFQDMDKKAPIVVVPTVARCGVGRCFTGGSVHCTLCTGCFHYKVTPAINQSRGNETTPGSSSASEDTQRKPLLLLSYCWKYLRRAFARLVPPILLIPLEIEIMSTNNFHQQNTEWLTNEIQV